MRAQEAATHIVGGPPDEVVLRAAGHGAEDRERQDPASRGARSLSRQDTRVPQRALWWQIARLSFAGLAVRISQLRRMTGEHLYAAWWWTVIGTGFLLGWLAVMLLPRLAWRWAALRALARTALKAARDSRAR